MTNDIYKLYSEHKSNGDVKLREINQANYGQEFITESYNMQTLLNEIEKNGDKSKTYIIQKYRPHSGIVYRNLGKNFITRGDTTVTWERISYCEEKGKWKPTNFRYRDEVV